MSRNAWLIAFADLSAVLCAFFVMMLAMSDFDAPALERMATIFGDDEGSWNGERPTNAPLSALRRSDNDAVEQGDYLAAVLTSRLAQADWPWSLTRRTDGIALVQVVPPGGPVLPSEMAGYLGTLGYPMRVSAVLVVSGDRVAGTISGYDDGLRQAGQIAETLEINGVGGAVPVAARYAGDNAPNRIEIIFDSRVE